MKKKIYSVCLFAVMGLISVQAQGLMKPKAKAVPEKAMTSSKTLPELVRTDQMRTVDAAEIEGQTVKKILPVAFLHSDGAEAGPEGKISYDLQGNISQISYSDESVETFDYTYNAQHKWVTLQHTKMNAQKEEIAKFKTERSFDAKGRLLSIHATGFDYDTQEWYPVSDHEYSYDKETETLDESMQAYVVKDLTYEKVGNRYMAHGTEYVWYEAAKAFIECKSDEYRQETVVLDGNNYTKVRKYYYGNSSSDEPNWCDYDKCEALVNQPAEGYVTLTYYRSSDGVNWEFNERIAQTQNFDSSFAVNDGKHREKTVYSYDESTLQYQIQRKDAYDWVNHPTLNLVKHTHFYYDDGELKDVNTTYEKVENGDFISDNSEYYIAADNSYTVLKYPDNSDEVLLTFYDAHGKETRRIRSGEDVQKWRSPSVMEEYENGKWVALKNATITLGAGSENHTTVKTNELGYGVWSEIYEDGKLSETSEIKYTDNGYVATYYEANGNGVMYLEEIESAKLLADGSTEIIYTDYDEDGEIEEKERTVVQIDGIETYYNWDEDANDWKISHMNIPPVSSTNADGVSVTILRRWNGEAIEEYQTILEDKNADGTKKWTEIYNKEDGEWKPSQKTEYAAYSFGAVSCTLPSNPLPAIIPQSLFNDFFLVPACEGVSEISYGWNEETNSWDTANSSFRDFSYSERQEDGYKIVEAFYRGKPYTYYIDSKNRLVVYEGPDGPARLFDYDEEGRVTQMTFRSNEVESYVIEYGQVEVSNGISAPAVQLASHLRIAGKTITAAGVKQLQLFSADGKLVGNSLNGTITAPSSGIYIVVADGKRLKVVL
ncbi:hypothetical protein KUA49_009770 [Segatella copri]|uniref:hypothetical protein n=1 Tax=Segatella copri TaxID=165179 RepID=UPI001C43DC59|nr:hypothetical protein [Segatella copri]WOZ83469.1 hypothetical protein KUA49_009770 [Segatella copri]